MFNNMYMIGVAVFAAYGVPLIFVLQWRGALRGWWPWQVVATYIVLVFAWPLTVASVICFALFFAGEWFFGGRIGE